MTALNEKTYELDEEMLVIESMGRMIWRASWAVSAQVSVRLLNPCFCCYL